MVNETILQKPCVFLYQLSTQYLLEAAMCLPGWGRQAQKTMWGEKKVQSQLSSQWHRPQPRSTSTAHIKWTFYSFHCLKSVYVL